MKSKILTFFILIIATVFSKISLQHIYHYEAPKSTSYPFGDEDINDDIMEGRVQEESNSVEIDTIKNIYTFCPNASEFDEEDLENYNEEPFSYRLCQKCDVRPTVDKSGALVECYNCTVPNFNDLSGTEERLDKDHILFFVNYLEISNYSIPRNPNEVIINL